jgi:hypothetical protein
MATLYWRGDATAVAGVETGSVDTVSGTPSDSTYTVTIGGVAIDEVGDTDVATTATNLRATLNASTHPYFAAITWSGSAGDIIGTADTAGVPFIAALTVAGGTGTVTDFVETTASAGPSDWSTGENWVNAATGATGTIPASADDVVIENSTNSIVYGLDQNAVALDSLEIRLSFTGKIGGGWPDSRLDQGRVPGRLPQDWRGSCRHRSGLRHRHAVRVDPHQDRQRGRCSNHHNDSQYRHDR